MSVWSGRVKPSEVCLYVYVYDHSTEKKTTHSLVFGGHVRRHSRELHVVRNRESFKGGKMERLEVSMKGEFLEE